MERADNGFDEVGRVTQGSSRKTGAPGRRVLVIAAWQDEERALRAMVTRLKELVPYSFEILNLESPTTVRYRDSSRALYGRIRRYDAAVFALSARDGTASQVLRFPSEKLPFSRFFRKRKPAVYLVDGPSVLGLEAAIAAHARSWRLRLLGIVSDEKGVDGLESLFACFINDWHRR